MFSGGVKRERDMKWVKVIYQELSVIISNISICTIGHIKAFIPKYFCLRNCSMVIKGLRYLR